MKLLRYENPKDLIHYYYLSNNSKFKNIDQQYVFTVKENANQQDLLDLKHDIEKHDMKYDRVCL